MQTRAPNAAVPSDESIVRAMSALPGTAAVLAVLTGILVLFGWTFDIEPLKRIAVGLVAVNPITAVGLLLSGYSLWSLRRPRSYSASIGAGRVAAVAVLLVGAVRFMGYARPGWDCGIDQILFGSKLGVDSTGIPNRMAPNTAVLFILLGASLALLDCRVRMRMYPAEAIALLGTVLAVIASLGYAFGVQSMYGVRAFIPMALPTAITFLVLFIGVATARPSEGWMATMTSPHLGGFAARRLLPGAIVITLTLSWLRLQAQEVGLFDTEFGVAMMAAVLIALLSALVWWSARLLNRVDVQHQNAQQSLHSLHDELQQKHALVETVIESAGDGIVVADREGRFLFWNKAAREIVGLGPTDVSPDGWQEHYGVFRADGTTPFPPEEVALRLAIAGQSVSEQVQFLRNPQIPDGKWVSVSARPLRDASGQSLGGVVVFRDITERYRAHEHLRAFNVELEKRVVERTTDLTRAVAELQQFAYVASHDLQEPLRMVTSYLQLLERRYRSQLDADADEFIHFAVDGANRMKQLISDLLDYSRVERKGGRPVLLDSGHVAREAIENLKVAIEETGADIRIGELPEILADPTQLRQVFQNLLGNAIKFHGEAPPRIQISAAREGESWTFSVRDNGIGIDPQHSQRIFEVFQRLHARHEYPGTGIGLAVCKKIIERLGGRIWVESEPGRGANFKFTLPQLEVIEHEQHSRAA